MKRLFTLTSRILLTLFLTSTAALSQDMQALIDEFEAGNLPLEGKEIPLLIPFAKEWDSLAATDENTGELPNLNQYQALTSQDGERLREAFSALAGNDDAVAFFTEDDTINAFNEAYTRAQNQGSPVGLIPHEQALRYWMASRALTTGPDILSAYPGGYASPEWCLPPLIRCTPPIPVPKEQ
jgi:hypothetical protein